MQNENDCVSAATAPPTIVTLTGGIIDTSCNEIIVENRVGSKETSAQGLSDKSSSVPLGRVGDDGRLKGYFCSDVVFNLSHRVLSELEIEVLGKGLGFSPTPSFINEADLKRDFANFSRKMRCSGISELISVKTLVKHQLFTLSLLGIHHKDTLH